MARKKKMYQDGSIAHFADLGFSKVKKYAKSKDIVDKLLGFNILALILVLGLAISDWLYNNPVTFSLDYIVMLAFSIVIAAVLAYFYSFILEPIVDLADRNINGLRLSVIIQFIALTVVLGGLLFNLTILTNIGAGLLGVQILALFFGGFIKVTDEKTELTENKPKIWQMLGRVGTLITIGTFVVNIILFIVRSIIK